MDKIYSRKKIRLPNIKGIKTDKTRLRKIYFVILIFTISIITGYTALKSIDPIFEGLCIAKAQGIATEITNQKSSEVLARYNYQDTVKIIESEDGFFRVRKIGNERTLRKFATRIEAENFIEKRGLKND